jgi:molybdenum cofactor biosynthesis enzyme MoaA
MNSKTFCIATWAHACVQPTGHLTPCCVWQAPPEYKYQEFDSWVNSNEMIATRRELHSGNKISSCNTCWKDESAGKKSLRQIYNAEFSKHFDFKNLNQDWTVDSSTSTFDFKLGNLCNLKCVMCNGESSSQLMTEYRVNQDKFSKLTQFRAPAVGTDFAWPLSQEFADFLSRFKDQIRWLKFTGGEPTVVPYVIDILETIPHPELVTVSFTTNATQIDSRLLKTLSKFKVTWITASLEGIQDHNNQIRYPSKWAEVESNVLQLAQLTNSYFSISHVLQCFSVRTLIPLLNWCDQHALNLQIIPIANPEYLKINSISTQEIQKFKQQLTSLTLAHNQSTIKQVLALLDTHCYDSELETQMIQYLMTLDDIRETKLTQLVS